MSSLAKFLKEKRVAAGLTQMDLADRLGYSTPQFISNWERGVSNPPINSLKKLGNLYGISAEELFRETLHSTIEEVTKDLRRKFATSKS